MRYMTIGDVIDYADSIKQNSFSALAKTVWLNEIEYRVQSDVMLLAAENIGDYVYSDSIAAAGIIYSANTITLPKRLKARAGGVITISGSVNSGSYAVTGVSSDGKVITIDSGLTAGTEERETLVKFDGSGCELLVPAPWSEIYYDYLLMKMSEHLEESSEQNNRAATFDKAFTRLMRWWADTYNPSNGRAVFKGYYIKGEHGENGYTPVRGTDYWTADDIADIKKYIDGTASSGAAAVVIEGTVSPDASAVTITTPDAWSIVYEAWSSDRHPPVVLRLTTGIDEAALYAYLICVIIADVDVRFALFSLAEIAYLDNTPPYTITLNYNNTAEIEPAIDTTMSDTSGAAVQNKAVKKYIDDNAQPKGDYALRSELFSGSYNDLTNKPVSMKNPFALTIKIGSTTVTYDGSEAKTVEIADGREVSY